jgi:transposase
MAHVRRKFFNVSKPSKSPLARTAMDKIAALYGIEADIRGRPPDERLRVRLERTAPVLAKIKSWLETTLTRVPGRGNFTKAIRYALSRRDALALIPRDGRACIDNSAAERAMRPIALGRRNWTFAGSDTGGERAVAIYSLITTAKLHGLDPEAHLRHVLKRIASHPVNHVHELLP